MSPESQQPTLKLLKSSKCWGGVNKRYEYQSQCCDCPLKLTIFFPPAAERGPVPVIYYLGSLTTDDETFIEQAGAHRRAADLGVALVCSDNSPRDIPGIPEQGEWPNWQYGYAASWYLDATADRFRNWQMRQWISEELPGMLCEYFHSTLDTRHASIMGFSMGGHGALTIGLAYAEQYMCISAFAPVCTPASSRVGDIYFSAALGSDMEAWKQYDACELVAKYSGPHRDVLIDVGSLEHFPVVDPHRFAEAAAGNANITLTNRVQEGYGHNFAFVASFVAEHLDWHMQHLSRKPT